MNSKEFYQEVMSSDICPENFELVYKDFQQYQNLALETLKAFHTVCEGNGIHYQLAFGSLLGAIRDDGQIPWDYDIDVIIPYAERYKLVEALKKELPEDFYFYCPENNDECRHYFMRVTPKGYRSDRLHVDVFYVIGAPVDLEERILFEAEMFQYFHLRYIKLVRVRDFAKNQYRYKLATIYKKIKCMKYSLKDINSNLERICEQHDPCVTGVSIPVHSGVYKKLFWNTDELWSTMLLDTSVGTFRITSNYASILRGIYKDYNKIYPLQSRLEEMYKSYNLIKNNISISKKSNGRYYYSNT